jgi:CBS domain-containing protein
VQAHELASPYPTVRLDTSAARAVRVLTEHDRPGLIVVDDNDHPVAVLPASQVLRMMIPRYVQDDPTLARVLDEDFADKIYEALSDKTVSDLLPSDKVPLPVVAPDDTVLEIAAIMAANRSPLVAVLEKRSKTAPLLGAVSASQLVGRVLPKT